MNSLQISLLGRGGGLRAGNDPGHNSLMDGKEPAVGRCVLAALGVMVSSAVRAHSRPVTGWHSPVHKEDLPRHRSSLGAFKNVPACLRCKGVAAQSPKESCREIPSSLKNHAHVVFILASDMTVCTLIYLISK